MKNLKKSVLNKVTYHDLCVTFNNVQNKGERVEGLPETKRVIVSKRRSFLVLSNSVKPKRINGSVKSERRSRKSK